MSNKFKSKKLLPHYNLSKWIKTYWLLEGIHLSDPKNYERYILPDGCTTILFILRGNIKLSIYDNMILEEGVYIIPPVSRSHKDTVSNDIFFIDIQLNPGVFYQLFNFPVNELETKIYNFNDISIKFDKYILSNLIELRNNKFLLLNELNAFFLKLFNKNDFFGDELLLSINQLYKDGDLEKFYCNQNKSKRHIQRKVNEVSGITPKMISRLGRFYKLLEESNGCYEDLKNSTYFSDQSHLIREFKYFTGITPKSFMNKESIYLQFEAIIDTYSD